MTEPTTPDPDEFALLSILAGAGDGGTYVEKCSGDFDRTRMCPAEDSDLPEQLLAWHRAGVQAEHDRMETRIAELEAERNGAYRERAQLLSLLALDYPAFITEAPDIPCDHTGLCDGPHWHLLFLTIGGRQATWHVAPGDMGLWAHVPYVRPEDPRVQWDGHTTEQKYAWIAEYIEVTCEEAGA